MHPALRRLFVVAICATALAVAVSASRAQEHNHPPQDVELHEKFYSTWMRPDQPNLSCCDKQDCYPAEAHWHNGQWHAKRREDGKWIRVPPEKVEQVRDSPDGRNHVCMPRPVHDMDERVYCFKAGSGI